MTGVLKVDDIQDAGANSIVSSNGSGTLTLGSFTAPNITASTAILPDASDGAAIGSASLEWSDIFLADGAVINLGDDQDVTLTHVADTGIQLNSTMKLMFNDASQYIQGASATVLDIAATDEIELTATLVDLNGNLDVSGTYTGAGLMTTGGNIVIPDTGNIGSASDTDAIAIAANGVTTFSQAPVLSGASLTAGTTPLTTLDIDGGTDIGEAIVDADLFIIDNGAGGTNRKTAASRIKTYIGAGSLLGAHHWRITAAHNNMDNGDHVTNNWEQADSYGYGGIGTAMSQSSGIFTFPSTGIWYVSFTANGSDGTAQLYVGGQITTTTDNSSYNIAAQGNTSIDNANEYFTTTINYLFDVTNTTTHKVRFAVHCQNNGIALTGNTNRTDTGATFIRLGDT